MEKKMEGAVTDTDKLIAEKAKGQKGRKKWRREKAGAYQRLTIEGKFLKD